MVKGLGKEEKNKEFMDTNSVVNVGGGGGERVYGGQMVMEKNNKTKFKQIIK